MATAKTRRTKAGVHIFKPHAAKRKCKHCRKNHFSSEHWSHSANTGPKSYKKSRGIGGAKRRKHAKKTARTTHKRRSAAQLAATRKLVAANRKRKGGKRRR